MTVLYTRNKTTTTKFDSLLQSVLPTGVFHQEPENRITQANHSMVKQNWTVISIRQFQVAAVLHHTEISCNVALFSDTCDPMKDIYIVLEATGFTSVTFQQYILVFHEALYIPELDYTLINSNKLRQFHTQSQDNPYHAIEPLNITNPIGDFIACLESQGTNIFLDPWFPTQTDLAALTQSKLTIRQNWNPHQIEFPSTKYYVKD